MIQFRRGNKVLDVLRLHFNLDQCDMHFLSLEFSRNVGLPGAPTPPGMEYNTVFLSLLKRTLTMTFAPIFAAAERILLTLWIGGMWVVGLVVAPTLFKNYERVLAGDIAGRLFSMLSIIGVICALLLLISCLIRTRIAVWRDWRAGVLLLMLAITLVGEFGVAARMREVKELLAVAPAASDEFQWLHRSASILFLINSVLGLILVISGARPRVQAGS